MDLSGMIFIHSIFPQGVLVDNLDMGGLFGIGMVVMPLVKLIGKLSHPRIVVLDLISQ